MTLGKTTAPSRRAAVYRLYDAEGTLLYIGSTYDPAKRYQTHSRKPWWPLVARHSEEWFSSKDAAYSAEMSAIAAEAPTYNEMGTPRYVPPSVKAAARRSHRSGELTVKEIMAKHKVSRQSLHTYRQQPDFPVPVSRPGTGGLRWQEDEVAAFFEANPKQPGKKRTDLAPEQGEPMADTAQEENKDVNDADWRVPLRYTRGDLDALLESIEAGHYARMDIADYPAGGDTYVIVQGRGKSIRFNRLRVVDDPQYARDLAAVLLAWADREELRP